MKRRLSVLIAIGFLAACGSDDAEPAAVDAEQTDDTSDTTDAEQTDDTADVEQTAATADTTDADADSGGDDDGGNVVISDFNDLPKECRDLMTSFLKDIEPTVSQVDWDNATMADLEALAVDLEDPSTQIGDDMTAAGCDDFDFGANDEASFDLAIDLAEREAPGVVGWLEFIRDVSSSFDTDTGVPTNADIPEDCDGAIAYVKDLMSQSASMTELPVDELMNVSSAMLAIQSQCSIQETATFFEDEAVTDWLDGG